MVQHDAFTFLFRQSFQNQKKLELSNVWCLGGIIQCTVCDFLLLKVTQSKQKQKRRGIIWAAVFNVKQPLPMKIYRR